MWRNPKEIPNNGIDDDGNGYIDDVYGYDFVNNNGNPMDDNDHGTHVAGTIAGVGNNGLGIAGVNWSGKIMALKFLDASGSGNASNAIRAVQYATQMGVKCTNNSWGGGGYSQALFDAIKAAGNSGSLFVAAAGNNGTNTDNSPNYPSNYNLDNIISVCASDHNDKLASFSNYGATSVDLCAPGVGIYSSLPNNQYASFSGTSMATPHVSGAVALLWAAHPELSAAQVKAKIMASVDVKPNLQGSSITSGRLNLYQTLSDISQAKDFIVTNTGQAIVTLGQISLTGQNPNDFKMQQNTCSGSLNPNATCNVTIGFVPTNAGSKQI
jgi:subtilisin family serine protease